MVNIGNIVQLENILILALSLQEKHLIRLRGRRKTYGSVTIPMARDRLSRADVIVDGIDLISAEYENPSVGDDINGLFSQIRFHKESAKYHI